MTTSVRARRPYREVRHARSFMARDLARLAIRMELERLPTARERGRVVGP